MEPLQFVRQTPPFDGLQEGELQAVERALEIVYLPRGTQVLTRAGPPGAHLYLIRKGLASLAREGQVLQVLEEGDFFGYPSLLSGSPPAFDVRAEEDTLAYRLPAAVFHGLLANQAFAAYFLHGLSDRLGRAARFQPALTGGDLIATPLGALIDRPPLFVAPRTAVGEAARHMSEAGVSSLIVIGEPPGIVTDRDLRSRVLAAGAGAHTPVEQVMSRPLKTLPAATPVYDALLFMLEENIHHLPLTRGGAIVGVITDTGLLRHQARTPLYLRRRLERHHDPRALAGYAGEIAAIVESLFQGGVSPLQIGRVVASLNDALARRLLHDAEQALGPPPTPYAWLVLGSEGRLEQALLTDQDNALAHLEGGEPARAYFQALALRVVEGLQEAGFPPCPGGTMATRWRHPRREWIRRFQAWTETPDPRSLMEASIFFDLRPVHGTLDLGPMEQAIAGAGRRPLFLRHLARNALAFQPPMGLLRRLRDEEGGIDLKAGGIMPVVGLARLYGLQAGLSSRATGERLQGAAAAGILTVDAAERLADAFGFCLQLRLRAQLEARRQGRDIDERVHLDSLTSLERRHLKEAFLSIREMQAFTAQQFQTERLA